MEMKKSSNMEKNACVCVCVCVYSPPPILKDTCMCACSVRS